MLKSLINACSWLLIGILLVGCNDDDDETLGPIQTFSYNFEAGTEGWVGDFTDYPTDWEVERFEFMFEHQDLPEEVGQASKGLLLSSRNISDDVFMFVKRQLTGLRPNHTYELTFNVELASQYPERSAGIGGSPGGSVYLKAGGATEEPVKVEEGRHYRINIDKGNQSQGGEDMVVIGTVGIPGEDFVYQLIERDNANEPVSVTTDAAGSLWVIVGTDSGFEGTSTLYYNSIEVQLKE